ncbi:DUF2093 domain-containing protein [Phenylobacterium deserti]|uniref:DUF2093 domain-containing protein n=1 Tax=Phenylobacterium deserti TaxID=1914756 RepID=A0A328ATN4_9CAUL|nr:DUF2093 domain-containing protein [Phenylobacterium deserti]RAK57046.1 DUF2093 domain-containing protein [Phenylobacterium deserti]
MALDDQQAVLDYGTPDFDVVKPGAYVLCAVTGKRIPLDQLLYWSVELQEAYAGAAELTARMKQLGRTAP